MRTGLVLVLGCLLLEASLVIGAEEKGVKTVQEAKVDSRVEKVVVEDVAKRNVRKVLVKRKKIDNEEEENIDPEKISEDQQYLIKVETTDNITREDCNVSTKVNGSSSYLNITNCNSTLDKGVNVSREVYKFNHSLENLDQVTDAMDSEEYFTESATTEYYDPKKFERRSDDFGDETFIEDEVNPTRKSSPKLDKEMVEIAFKGDQASKIKSLLEEEHDPKKFQRRTFDIMGMLGFKNNKYDTVYKITKEVAVPVPYTLEKRIPVPVKVEHPVPVHVPKAYPVTVEKKVYYPVKEYIHAPYPVYKKVPYLVKIAVEKPVPVHIEKPYPVYIERKVPYPVEKQIHYPVKIPVDRPIPVKIPFLKNIYYPVEKKVVYPVAVPVEKPVAVPVEKPYPVYVEKEVPVPVETHVPYEVPIEEHKHEEEISTHSAGYEYQDHSFVPSQPIKVDFTKNEYGKTEGGFIPIIEDHDSTKLQDKKDEEVTLEEPEKRGNATEQVHTSHRNTTLLVANEKKNGDINKTDEKDIQEFGRKIKKS